MYKRYTYLLPNRHVFKFTYNASKDVYEIIFGNGVNDYHLQMLEDGIYQCWFDIVEKSNVLLNPNDLQFVWPHSIDNDNIEIYYPYLESDYFLIYNNKN